MSREGLPAVAIASFVLIGAYYVHYLQSLPSRLTIVLMFFAPIIWATATSARAGSRRDWPILVAALVTPAFIFLIRNASRLSQFLEGIDFSETRMLAEEYVRLGAMRFPTAHSSFFQTPYLMYTLAALGDIPIQYVAIVIIMLQIVFAGVVAVYAVRVIRSKSGNTSLIAPLVVFSLLSSRTLMSTNVPYRYLGSTVFLLTVFFFYRSEERPRSWSSPVVLMILLVGTLLGDPMSAIAAILFFGIYALERRDISAAIYFILPIAYLVYAGLSYSYFLKTYSEYAWGGFTEFFEQLFVGIFAERVLPWGRTTSYTLQDSYVMAAAYLSLMLLAVGVAVFHAYRLWVRNGFASEKSRAGVRAASASLSCMLVLGIVTYTGASTRPEVLFSDIRSIVLIFVFVFLLFSFNSKVLMTSIESRKAIRFALVGLLILGSLTVVYASYPKSFADPIQVVEDERLDLRPMGYAGAYLIAHYSRGSIIQDYKMYYVYLELLVHKPYIVRIIGDSRDVSRPYLLIFELSDLRYPSTYISQEAYSGAYRLAMDGGIVYSNGFVVVSIRE